MMSVESPNLQRVCVQRTSDVDWKVIPYTGNPEEKGIIYWIGCLNDTHQYLNPITQVHFGCCIENRIWFTFLQVEIIM